ncbi:hypothetical protein Pcinc_022585 [Petrolisthes cinctipes]|uniref:Uncharacterized protein n=1 Tax=Petrolisthes cinctipes TaxID=88211 RepID=A0AAE1FEE9_PETCI|nr:hypothetical protein Pcinc_022585 [Petrolisthes cinctipes]
MKSSKWTLARKTKKKCYNYPYYVKKRLETDTPEKIPPSSSQSVVAAAIMEDKEMMWSSDGEEAVDGGEISSSSDVNDVSVRQVHKMLDTQILSGESSIHSSNSTELENNEEVISSNEVEGTAGGVRCKTEKPSACAIFLMM